MLHWRSIVWATQTPITFDGDFLSVVSPIPSVGTLARYHHCNLLGPSTRRIPTPVCTALSLVCRECTFQIFFVVRKQVCLDCRPGHEVVAVSVICYNNGRFRFYCITVDFHLRYIPSRAQEALTPEPSHILEKFKARMAPCRYTF